ncbi:MAG: hypothetical protein WBV80_07580 [Mycobacterium sp.]
MTAVIVVLVVLLAIGILANGLLRLRRWLQNSPSGEEFQPPLDDDDE